MKRRDPIIDELHRVREDIGKAHDFDVRRIAATIRQHEDQNPKGVVRGSPRRAPRQKESLIGRSSGTPELVDGSKPLNEVVPTGWHWGRHTFLGLFTSRQVLEKGFARVAFATRSLTSFGDGRTSSSISRLCCGARRSSWRTMTRRGDCFDWLSSLKVFRCSRRPTASRR
jgi:hypothetical protein